jgi:hypothetical protein
VPKEKLVPTFMSASSRVVFSNGPQMGLVPGKGPFDRIEIERIGRQQSQGAAGRCHQVLHLCPAMRTQVVHRQRSASDTRARQVPSGYRRKYENHSTGSEVNPAGACNLSPRSNSGSFKTQRRVNEHESGVSTQAFPVSSKYSR